MTDHDSLTPPERIIDTVLKARRRRHWKRMVTAIMLGCIVGIFTLGALDQRVVAEDQNDLLPVPIEALILGTAFAIGSLPVGWSFLGLILLPVPTFFLYFTVLIGKSQPLPYPAAFAVAILYSALLTVLARQLADRPERSRLGSRGAGSPL